MASYNGIVTSANEKFVTVDVSCEGACEHCGACSGKTRSITAHNTTGAIVGDRVTVKIKNLNTKLVATLCYFSPIVFTIIVALVFSSVLSTLILSLVSLFCFIICLTSGIILSNRLAKKSLVVIEKGE